MRKIIEKKSSTFSNKRLAYYRVICYNIIVNKKQRKEVNK
nr:MAG TPA: hypothetical protein [Caudoviricetes sp.]